MITMLESNNPRVLGFKLSGTLHDEDYQTFGPAVDEAVARADGKVRMLVQMEDFHGWDAHSAWDDLKFGIKHYADTERIAVVGERKWEEWMTRLWSPFTRAEVKYFDAPEAVLAWGWVREGL